MKSSKKLTARQAQRFSVKKAVNDRYEKTRDDQRNATFKALWLSNNRTNPNDKALQAVCVFVVDFISLQANKNN